MAEPITIDFIDDCNVEEQSQTDYEQFIVGLRQKLKAEESHTLPVLPLQEDPPTHWFDVKLQTQDCGITLRIRRGNLNLDGYKTGTSSGDWLEFGSDSINPYQHLIPGSFYLGFSGDYHSLEDAAGVAGNPKRRNSINLGKKPLINAVNTLAKSKIKKSRAQSLIIVIRMICESIRYARISRYIVTHFMQEPGFEPEDWMNILEIPSNWGRLSLDLLKNDDDPTNIFQPLHINSTEIQTIEQVVNTLGIILHQPR